AKLATLIAILRTAMLTLRARVGGFSLVVGLALVLGLARFGGLVRRSRGRCWLGQRDPADDFVGNFGIRVHDDAHRDVEIVTLRRGRRLRERRRYDERQHRKMAPRTPHDALATHALSSPGAVTCSARLRRRV